ncbi:MAG: hypothetical protein ACXV3D_04575 [Halobacteriota archaeon]
MNVGVIDVGARKEIAPPPTSNDTAGKDSLLILRTVRTAIACSVRVRPGKTPNAKFRYPDKNVGARALTKIEA